MIIATVYITSNCSECDKVINYLDDLYSVVPHKVISINVDLDPVLKKSFDNNLPVVQIGPFRLRNNIEKKDLQVALSAAKDRETQLKGEDIERYKNRLRKGRTFAGGDRLSAWLSKHYMVIFNAILAFYVGIALLAPVMMKGGATGPARLIYLVYRPLCHQLAFRSFFLFGEQAYYPRELADVQADSTYEDIIGTDTILLRNAQNEIGNEVIGYKVALCERCMAIYGSMLVFGLIFSLVGRKWKSLPWFLWIIIGLGPIGLDGVSQLPSLVGRFTDWVIIRESTPFLRVLTGSLFGITTAWYLFPFIEESMQESRVILAKKMAISIQLEDIIDRGEQENGV
mgnify:CR=1 FL=1